jgi:hypothetical protein
LYTFYLMGEVEEEGVITNSEQWLLVYVYV